MTGGAFIVDIMIYIDVAPIICLVTVHTLSRPVTTGRLVANIALMSEQLVFHIHPTPIACMVTGRTLTRVMTRAEVAILAILVIRVVEGVIQPVMCTMAALAFTDIVVNRRNGFMAP